MQKLGTQLRIYQTERICPGNNIYIVNYINYIMKNKTNYNVRLVVTLKGGVK